jgi:hypothetical protein
MLSEFENIQHGKPLQHPDQFRPAPGMPSQLSFVIVLLSYQLPLYLSLIESLNFFIREIFPHSLTS